MQKNLQWNKAFLYIKSTIKWCVQKIPPGDNFAETTLLKGRTTEITGKEQTKNCKQWGKESQKGWKLNMIILFFNLEGRFQDIRLTNLNCLENTADTLCQLAPNCPALLDISRIFLEDVCYFKENMSYAKLNVNFISFLGKSSLVWWWNRTWLFGSGNTHWKCWNTCQSCA